MLPLSGNVKLDKQFGTRHRAAIGITEETDAVVVVISEERGEVSLCFNGNIAHSLEAAMLRKALLGLFQKKSQAQAGRPAMPRTGAAPGSAKNANSGPGTLKQSDGGGTRKSRPSSWALFSTQPISGPVRRIKNPASAAAPAANGATAESTTVQTSAKSMLARAERRAAAPQQSLARPLRGWHPAKPSELRPDSSAAGSVTGPMTEQTTAKFRIPLLEAAVAQTADVSPVSAPASALPPAGEAAPSPPQERTPPSPLTACANFSTNCCSKICCSRSSRWSSRWPWSSSCAPSLRPALRSWCACATASRAADC